MKNILDIYKEYKINKSLVMHQLRVASVALVICDSFDFPIDKKNIIKACLLHDMGNIIKFDLNYFPEHNEPEGKEYWQGVKNDYVLRYGENEHHASLKIAEELDLNTRACDLIKMIDSDLIDIIAKESDFEAKICMYCDGRVTPHGVVSIEERSLEAKERYKNHPHNFDEERRIFFNKNLSLIENQIFSHSKLKPDDIDDSTISEILKKLKGFTI